MGKGESRNGMAIFILPKLIYFSHFLYAFYGWFEILLLQFRIGLAKKKTLKHLCSLATLKCPVVMTC